MTGLFQQAHRAISLSRECKIICNFKNILASRILFYSLTGTLVVYSDCSETTHFALCRILTLQEVQYV